MKSLVAATLEHSNGVDSKLFIFEGKMLPSIDEGEAVAHLLGMDLGELDSLIFGEINNIQFPTTDIGIFEAMGIPTITQEDINNYFAG